MKDVAVYTGYAEVLKGAGDRLAHLRGEIAIRIVWEAVILAALICKLTAVRSISEQIQLVSYLRSNAFGGVVGKRLN
jgi:hypothetical protein